MKKRYVFTGFVIILLCFLASCKAAENVSDWLLSETSTTEEVQVETVEEIESADKEEANSQEETVSNFTPLFGMEGIEEFNDSDTEMPLIEDSILASYSKLQSGSYAYQTMDAKYKHLYLEILAILSNRLSNVVVSSIDTSEIDIAFQCVLMDHPEIFYVKGYTYTKFTRNEEIDRITFSGTYTMDRNTIDECRIKAEEYVTTCLNGLPPNADEYEKVKYVYEYLINHTEYNLDAPENQNICSIFIYGESVCQGYAKAMQYLLNRMGIFCTLVVGNVDNGEGHAWNLVQIDGAFYYVDATWGDAFYEFDKTNQPTEQMPTINYDYLCVTTEQLVGTHQIDSIVPMPQCVTTTANYYVKEGAYFEAVDETHLKTLFENAYAKEDRYVTLKCSDATVYQGMQDFLIKNQKIFQYLQGNQVTVTYTGNEEQLTLSFWL